MKAQQHIVIVGGGTSGWMAANMLATQLPQPNWHISVIESAGIPSVGVGEGSTPFFKQFFDQLGIDESTWMPACHATYKTGISFPGWLGKGPSDRYFHPFYNEADSQQVPVFFGECAARLKGFEIDAHPNDYFIASHLFEQGRAPVTGPYPIDYGYHFDAALLSDFLKQHAIGLGVCHIEDVVQGVEHHVNGDILSVITQGHGKITGEWFIDCSGFKRLLIQGAMRQRFVSFHDALLCDAAVAFPVTRTADQTIQSATVSEAIAQGWVWNIPLTHRTGSGLVYSRDWLSDDQALVALSQYHQLDEPPEHKCLKWQPGRVENTWQGNCVAIGLSQGFLEPLEAPMLNITQQSVELLIEQLLKVAQGNPVDIDSFNARVVAMFEGTRDYIQAHYLLNQRQDHIFWREAKSKLTVSEGLSALLHHWDKGLNLDTVLRSYPHLQFYLKTSWYCLLAGLNRFPTPSRALPGHSKAILQLAKTRAAKDMSQFPEHGSYLDAMASSFAFKERYFA